MLEKINMKFELTSTYVLNKIVSFVFLLFCIEVILMGPGEWSATLGVSVRKILFVLIFLLFIIHYFHYIKLNLIDICLVVCGFSFFLLSGFFIPLLKDVNLDWAVADVRPLMGFLLLPFIVSFYRKTKKWDSHRKIISFSLFLLAGLHVFLWIIGSTSRDMGEYALTTLRNIYEPGIAFEDTKLIAINYTPSGFFRVQWGSSSLLLLAFYFSLSQLNNKKTIYNFIYIFVSCVAVYATQSRGLFFALFLGLCHYWIFYYLIPLKKLDFITYFFGLSLIVVFAMMMLPFFTPEFLSLIGMSREGSDNERYFQVLPLLFNWFENFIWGSGFGSNIEIIRSKITPYAYEVSILTIVMKIGLFGLFVSLILCSALLSRVFNGEVFKYQKNKIVIIYSMVFVYVIASNTNPYLSNFFGMLVFYCFVLELSNQNIYSNNVE